MKVDNMVFDFVYSANVDDFPAHEDEANTMLNYLHLYNGDHSFQDVTNGEQVWSWWSYP
jgi:L-rhamnose mutarotase